MLIFLLRSSRRLVLGTIGASVLAGMFSAGLIAVVNQTLNRHGMALSSLVAIFVTVAVLKIVTQCASQLTLVHFAQDTVFTLCDNLCTKILAAPFDRLEQLGTPRILATLTEDVAVLTAAVQAIPTVTTNLAVIAGCGIYLAWLSLPMFALSALLVLAGVAGYRLLLRRAHVAIHAAREGRDRLFADFRTLTEGIKELKLNRARRAEFVNAELQATMENLRRQNVAATTQYSFADAWSQFVFLLLIAMLLFVAPSLSSLTVASVTGYVFAALYLMTPVWSIIGAVPLFVRGRVSLAKMRELGDELGSATDPAGAARPPAPPQALRIDFEQVHYGYPAASEDDRGFTLGPIDLTLRSGELVFVTGGNGSGKSTLAKLITGLYGPHGGVIRVDGEPVVEATREAYRQHFAAVFADFHLFGRLFGIEVARHAQDIDHYLKMLHMDGKVRIENGRFSSIALSTGQRKRLALLTAYLEDRPVYVFDEWAADQDPSYKEIFYMRLLPELKSRGKCVLVITHDDRYFNRGDRIIKLEGGRTVETPMVAPVSSPRLSASRS